MPIAPPDHAIRRPRLVLSLHVAVKREAGGSGFFAASPIPSTERLIFELPVAGIEGFPAVAVVEGVGAVEVIHNDFALLRSSWLSGESGGCK